MNRDREYALADGIGFAFGSDPASIFPSRIETERLELVQLTHEAIPAAELHQYLGVDNGEDIEEATEYTLWDAHETVADTAEYIDESLEMWDEREAATYLLQRRSDGETVGKTRMKIGWDHRAGWPEAFIRKPFWGNGYSGERMHALFELVFKELELQMVGASCAVGSERIRRPIQKYMDEHGGEHVAELPNWGIPESGEPMDCHYFTITREQYLDEGT
jgi:RimJ/RimL family protein N-acetyltransferase